MHLSSNKYVQLQDILSAFQKGYTNLHFCQVYESSYYFKSLINACIVTLLILAILIRMWFN